MSPAGEVVGAGKLKMLMSDDFPYDIPCVSFIVTKNLENKEYNMEYRVDCIELMISGYGNETLSAIKNMTDMCYAFLKTLFEKTSNPYEQLQDLFNTYRKDYWDAYNNFQLRIVDTDRMHNFL